LAEATALLKTLGVTLNADKTRIVHVQIGFEFLGYKIKRGTRPLRLAPRKIPARSVVASVRALSTPIPGRSRFSTSRSRSDSAAQGSGNDSGTGAPDQPGHSRLGLVLSQRLMSASSSHSSIFHPGSLPAPTTCPPGLWPSLASPLSTPPGRRPGQA
jgi:hypothetical protein